MAANTAPTLTNEDKAALFSHTKLGSWMLLHARLSTIGTRENSTPACVLTSPSLRDEQGWTLLHHAVDGGFAGRWFFCTLLSLVEDSVDLIVDPSLFVDTPSTPQLFRPLMSYGHSN